MAEDREITRTLDILVKRDINSSVIPSAKYFCAGSVERLSIGSTASDRIGAASSERGGWLRTPIQTPTPTRPRKAVSAYQRQLRLTELPLPPLPAGARISEDDVRGGSVDAAVLSGTDS